jgi:drug/metabolite transporter (DMT)-like permease
VAALALNLAGYGLHVVALRSAPLFLVQAAISSAVAVTAVLRALVLKVALRGRDWLAVLVVCAGVTVLALAALSSGTVTTTRGQRALLLAAGAAVAAVAALAARTHGPAGAAVLGFLSGLGYAIVALGTRLVPDLSPLTLVSDPATYAVVGSGVTAFLVYSTALQRSGVLTSTTAVIISQTAVPAIVGITLLGDAIRPGWTPVVVLALVAAVAGAVVLTRRDTLVEEARNAA